MQSPSDPVLVLSPHPDDETIGCGGTIKLLTNSGIAVDVAFITSGELGDEAPERLGTEHRRQLAEIRELEARSACDLLGVRDVFFLKEPDGRLNECPRVAALISGLLVKRDYRRIFCPGPQEAHVDHVATYNWMRLAVQQYGGISDVWLYEVWTPLTPNRLIPIDSTIENKLQAMRAHDSQLKCRDYLSAMQGLAAYRAMTCPPSKYAEAFTIVNSRILPETKPI